MLKCLFALCDESLKPMAYADRHLLIVDEIGDGHARGLFKFLLSASVGSIAGAHCLCATLFHGAFPFLLEVESRSAAHGLARTHAPRPLRFIRRPTSASGAPRL